MTSPFENLRINFDPKYLEPLCRFKAVHDIRYYLNGIYVERAPLELGGVYLVATDGHTMAVIHDKSGSIAGADSAIISITPQAVSAAKASQSRKHVLLKHRVLVQGTRLLIAPDFDCAAELYIQPGRCNIEGKFPNWRGVIPDFSKLKEAQITTNCVNANYLARLAGLTNDKYGSGITLWQDDPQKAIVCQISGLEEMVVFVMPMKLNTAGFQRGMFPYLSVSKAAEKTPEPTPESA
jgi:hypothetical protein